MRRLISILMFLLLAFCSVASAEGFDFATMSLDDLVALHESVDAEITARTKCDISIIPSGKYVAGVSIKAGMYNIACPEDYIDVYLFESEDAYSQYLETEEDSLLIFEATLFDDEEDIAFVNLEDGMVLLILDGNGEIQTAKADWMP